MLIREHGYATLNKSDDMNIRLAYHYEQKQKVAKKAVESIQHGETIMLESGSCCALVALEIAKTKKDVTLIDTGFTGNDYMRCEAVKDMARQASHVIIVTESDKFHQKGVSNLIDLHQVSCIYTDQGIPQEVEEYFNEKHIQVEKV